MTGRAEAVPVPPVAAVTTVTRVRQGPSYLLFVPRVLWWKSLMFALGTAVVLSPLWQSDSLWLGVGVVLTVFLIAHGLFASRIVPWIPGLIAVVATLQWILAAWAGYHVPPIYPLFAMVIPADEYFSFAVPAALLLTIGMFIPLARYGRRPRRAQTDELASPRLVATFRVMVLGGVFLRIVVIPILPASLQFAALLVANLAYVGMLAMVLRRAPHWPWYVALVLGMQAVYSSADGMFHDLLLWVTYLVAILAYTYRVRLRILLAGAVLGFILIFVLNGIKQEYRIEISSRQLTATERSVLLGEAIVSQLSSPAEAFSEEKLALNISRTNQGWLIARTLNYVPAAEPFADGETVRTALSASLLPRIIAPTKYRAGSTDIVSRFTGVPLNDKTSMGLSLAGEMYANFGRLGGLASVFMIGLLLGYLYRLFVRWSWQSSLWWAWAPYVMLYTMQAESGLAEALNHVVKSSIVMFAAIATIPAWSMLRRWRRRPRGPLSTATS